MHSIPPRFMTIASDLSAYPSWQVENMKAEFMEWLYQVYDRDHAPLGLRGTYTGLWQQFQKDLADMYRDGVLLTALKDSTTVTKLLTP